MEHSATIMLNLLLNFCPVLVREADFTQFLNLIVDYMYDPPAGQILAIKMTFPVGYCLSKDDI